MDEYLFIHGSQICAGTAASKEYLESSTLTRPKGAIHSN